MPAFTLKKHVDFTFDIEGVDGEFTIPALGSLTADAMQIVQNIAEAKEVAKKTELVKEFLLGYCPQLKECGIGDTDYSIIFNAYEQSQAQAIKAGK
jgi:hypothetical protein